MESIPNLLRALVTRLTEGPGTTTPQQRQDAFGQGGLPLLENVRLRPTRINDEDIAAALATGLSEDQLFELIVCAAVGQASRQHERALAALEAVK